MDDNFPFFDIIRNASNTVQQDFESLYVDGFCLASIVSNEPEVLKGITVENIEQNNDNVGVLGRNWNPSSDTIIIKPLTYFPLDAPEYTQKKFSALSVGYSTRLDYFLLRNNYS